MSPTQRNILFGSISMLVIAVSSTVVGYTFLNRKQALPKEALNALEFASVLTTARIDTNLPPDSGGEWGYALNAQETIENGEGVKRLAAMLKEGVANANASHAMACFIPRHMVEVIEGEVSYKFFICFKCARLRVMWGKTTVSMKDFYFSGNVAEVADLFPQDDDRPD